LCPLGFGGFDGEQFADSYGVQQVKVFGFKAKAPALRGLVHPVTSEVR